MWQQKLKSLLNQPLPGKEAQMAMAPVPVGVDAYQIPPADENTRKGAVLILLHPVSPDGDLSLTLTLRSSKLPSHSGQLSLPGGRLDAGETPIQAALRETHEEIGVPQEVCEVAGALTPLHVPHTRNLIHPIVATSDHQPKLHINPAEVAEAFHVRLDQLMGPAHVKKEIWELRGASWQVPYWDVHRVPLWGATAMILSEFCAVWRQQHNE